MRKGVPRVNMSGGSSMSYVVQTQLNAAERKLLGRFFLDSMKACYIPQDMQNETDQKALMALEEKIIYAWNERT